VHILALIALEMCGLPTLGIIDDVYLDQDVASKLWALGEEATGTSFPQTNR
jgi:hypothetical protein